MFSHPRRGATALALDVDALYRAHGPMVLRRCRRLLRDEEKAVDAMHDVFVKVLRSEAALTGERPAGLLLRIATNECLNRLRSDRRHPEDAEEELLVQIADATDHEARNIARRMLDRLLGEEPDSTRLVLVLHLVDGLTLEETAAEVGLSVSGVRKRLRTMKARVQARAAGEEV